MNSDFPVYAVAKFAPDIQRMEPQNIGVVVWSPHGVAAKFLDHRSAEFVPDECLYTRWVTYWTNALDSGTIRVGKNLPVEASDPGFLEALASTQKANFLMRIAGRVHEEIEADELDDVANFLFDQLVRPTRSRLNEENANQLREICDDLIEKADWPQLDGWKGAKKVHLYIDQVERSHVFNYVCGETQPSLIAQRVQIGRWNSVDSNAFLFEWLVKSRSIVDGTKPIALVDTSFDADTESQVKLLNRFAHVVDVANPSTARKHLYELAWRKAV